MIADDFKAIREGMKEKGLIPQEEEKPEDDIPSDSDCQPDWEGFYNPDFSKLDVQDLIVGIDPASHAGDAVAITFFPAQFDIEDFIENADHAQISNMMHLIANRLVALELDAGSDSD